MSKYLEILNNMPMSSRKRNDHIMLVDGLNTLVRCFSAIRTINTGGNHVGGLTGFLKSVGSLRRQFDPTRIVVVWDGLGGGQSRKNVDSNYKSDRANAPVIHWDIYDSKEDETESMRAQADRVIDYLACLPVTYIRLNRLEADDIIAFIANTASEGGKKVTIVSMDKDFLQLVNDNISVYSPTKKILYNREETFKFLGVLPENYNIVKALTGDKSDCLRGVQGVGTKTLVKMFPGLKTDPNFTLDDIFSICEENLGSKKVIYAKILADWNHVETNFKLMDLHKTVLDEDEQQQVGRYLKAPVPKVRIGPFMHMLEVDGIDNLTSDTEEWLNEFSRLIFS